MPVLDIPDLSGLTDKEARERLQGFGPNELPSAKPRNLLQLAWGVMREPMLLLLLGCCSVYFLLGDSKDALILVAFVVVVIGITLYQERKTERALDALRDLSSPRALVIRGGRSIRIAGRDVVPGDLLVLSEGDRVPADALLLSATNLTIDESLLTGESVPVRKMAGEAVAPTPRPGGESTPLVYSGTLVVGGSGIARAEATGIRTELGKIGRSLAALKTQPTPLEQDARRLVRAVALAALAVCALLVVLHAATRGEWLRGFLAALALAMSILPEELPVVLAVFLALGAWRISRAGVLTRQTPAIETLGAATVLCVDKTGTLTQNRMAVQKLAADGAQLDIRVETGRLPASFQELAEFAMLATRAYAFDPMDQAIRHLAERTLAQTGRLHPDWTLQREYPLSPQLLAVADVWSPWPGEPSVAAAKGAPEHIAELCRLLPEQSARLAAQISELAQDGLRVLGVAKARYSGSRLPVSPRELAWQFLGLLALADPVRPAVPDAVRQCRSAGIRVIMITGDFPLTARTIANQAGFGAESGLITGPELEVMPDQALCARVSEAAIFARALPEQKLRLVNALKAKGEVVAMTGDGVNDAPALKAAHIGIAMGQRGTDVAREAADLVLLDDDFSSIVHAVRTGRRIFDNLKKAVVYTFAVHVPIAGLSLVPVLFHWPLILQPVHIAFLELIIDPACSVVFEAEPEEAGIMQRPPRPVQERLFEGKTIAASMLQGAGVLALVLSIFGLAWSAGRGEAEARTLTFTTLVIANLCLIHGNRSRSRSAISILRSPNPATWWIAGGAILFLAAVLYVPFLTALFGFSRLDPNNLALCLVAGLSSLVWLEGLKAIERRVGSQPSRSRER